MTVRKNTLWKVPIFCIITGFISSYLSTFLTSKFAIAILSDGSVTIDNTRSFIIQGIIFLLVLVIGGFLVFRNMSKIEIFFSASIVVIFQIALIFIQLIFNITTGPGAIFFLNIYQLTEWSNVVTEMLCKVINNGWMCSFISSLTPYLFIPFGKNQI